MRGVLCLAGVAMVAACSSNVNPITIGVTAGLDGAPFDGTPAVTDVQLRVRATAGTETTVAHAAPSSGGIDVPDSAKQGVGALVLAGVDASGATVAWGRTPPLDLTGLQSTLPVAIAIMVQRVGTVARALNLDSAVDQPRCSIVGTRYLLVSDAASVDAHAVDLLDMTPGAEKSAWTAPPVTVAIAGSQALAIDASGAATLTDLDAQTTSTPSAPAGTTFADVAGGQVVTGDDGGTYIVGATRAAAASDVVLRLDSTGALAARKLLRARTSAAATWAPGRGLVVAYGHDASGIEILAPAATTATALAYPDHVGAGVIAPLDATHVARVDESGAAWSIDLACSAACAEVALPWKDAARAPREDDVALALEGGEILLVRGGNVSLFRGSGVTSLYDAGAASVCATVLPTGAAAIVTAKDPVLRTVLP